MPMRRVRYSGSLLLVIAALALPSAADDVPQAAAKRKEQILKRFAEEFVTLTPGQAKFPALFHMGSKDGPANEQPEHKVTLSYSFAVCKYEVTQELYEAIAGNNPSRWKGPRN